MFSRGSESYRSKNVLIGQKLMFKRREIRILRVVEKAITSKNLKTFYKEYKAFNNMKKILGGQFKK